MLPIIEKNVYTNANMDMNIDFRTLIYSFYMQSDFNEMGYLLHRLNHWVWLGQGSYHTNTIESL